MFSRSLLFFSSRVIPLIFLIYCYNFKKIKLFKTQFDTILCKLWLHASSLSAVLPLWTGWDGAKGSKLGLQELRLRAFFSLHVIWFQNAKAAPIRKDTVQFRQGLWAMREPAARSWTICERCKRFTGAGISLPQATSGRVCAQANAICQVQLVLN